MRNPLAGLIRTLFPNAQGPAPSRRPRGARQFKAAVTDRLTGPWPGMNQPITAPIKMGLKKMRARSRQASMNDEFMIRFLQMVRTNVVGPNGVQLRPMAKFLENGNLDAAANTAIKTHWKRWGKKMNSPEVTGKYSFVDCQNLVLDTLMRDGEVLIRHLPGEKFNDYRYSFQFIDVELLDVNLNKELPNGGAIVMGVEVDRWRRPVAYHLMRNRHQTDDYYSQSGPYDRIPAEQIEHLFLPRWVWQVRGVPMAYATLARMQMLDAYYESELVAARVGSSKMGFFKKEEWYQGEEELTDDDEYDAAEGTMIQEAAPGEFEELPYGYDFVPWDPQHPNAAFKDFSKAILRKIASGLGVSYTSLANDGEGVNLSTQRHFVMEERDVWKALQGWLIDSFLEPVFNRWLLMALTAQAITIQTPSGAKPLPVSKLEKYAEVAWQPRRWDWHDPQKDATATQIKIRERLTSRSKIIREGGDDPDEIFQEIADENRKMDSLGIKPEQVDAKLGLSPSPAQQPGEGEDIEEPDEDTDNADA